MNWRTLIALSIGLTSACPQVLLGNFSPLESLEQEEQHELEELLDNMFTMALEQTQTITSCLDDLILYLNRGSIRAHNADNARNAIQHLKSEINHLVKPHNFRPFSPESLNQLLNINTILAQTVDSAINKGLDNLPFLRQEDFILRSNCESDLDEITEKLFAIDERVDQLKKKAEQAGLTIFNKGYRIIEGINNRYNLLPNMFKAGCIGAGALLTLYMIPKETFDSFGLSPDSKLVQLKRFLGEKAPILDIGGEKIPYDIPHPPDLNPQQSPGFLRTLEDAMTRSGITYGGLGVTLVLKDYIGDPIKEFAKNKYAATKRAVLNFHHKLRGSNIEIVDPHGKEILDYDQISDELVGLEWAKAELESAISYICDPDRYDRLGIPIPKGYLFTGLPGTGKTALAQWICAEINHRLKDAGKHERVGFKSVKWYELFGGNGIKDVIDDAKEDGPYIVFIDEIDTVGAQRDRASQLLNEILQELSGINEHQDAKHQLIFIGATNKPEHIDPAMRRSGRLGKELFFPVPDQNQRVAFFDRQCSKLALDPDQFNTNHIARQTMGLSYADLRELTGTAALNALLEQKPLNQRYFQNAIDRMRGLTHAKKLTGKQQTIISAYIAGRTAAHLLLGVDEIMSASILPHIRKIKEQNVWNKAAAEQALAQERINLGKVFLYNENENSPLYSEDDLLKQMQILLSGHVAEKIILGSAYTSHHEQDKTKALKKAAQICAGGLNLQKIPMKLLDQYIVQAEELLNECEKTIETQLRKHTTLIYELSHALQEKQTLYSDEINKIYQTYLID